MQIKAGGATREHFLNTSVVLVLFGYSKGARKVSGKCTHTHTHTHTHDYPISIPPLSLSLLFLGTDLGDTLKYSSINSV